MQCKLQPTKRREKEISLLGRVSKPKRSKDIKSYRSLKSLVHYMLLSASIYNLFSYFFFYAEITLDRVH